MNISWYEAKEVCSSYNANLLSYSSHNDVLMIHALLAEIWHNTPLLLSVFIGLKGHSEVNVICKDLKNIFT